MILVLVGNAIGKAKQSLKAAEKQVPLLAYDSFLCLVELDVVTTGDLPIRNAATGLPNRIVHDYMNIDVHRVLELVKTNNTTIPVYY